MQRLSDSPLVAAASYLDRPAVLGLERAWTWRQIHEASVDLSHRLGDATAVCNLCASRSSFLVTLLAALRSARLLILPPSAGNADLAAVLKASPGAVIVVDDPQAVPAPWRRVTLCVTCPPECKPAHFTATELAWQPAWDATAVLLYTSGSTGAPEPQPKSLRHLVTGARVLGARLSQEIAGGLPAIRRIVCSVPPQHMFGLETSVMLPLVHGLPVLDRRPLLPADVREAFSGAELGAWIATPLHLRSLVQAVETVPNCSVVIVSTMPLTQTLAQQTEDLVAAPLLEIYGSTETGVLAMRRTARETRWRPVDGVQLESSDAGTQARGSHFASPPTLLDQIRIDEDGRFALLGRQADLIKIAGRRASLARLNLLLQELPGLEDGVFYLPAGGNPTERLCLIHSGTLDRAATNGWLRTQLDPVFLPRTLIRVDRLPRSDNGKLPRQALDRVFEQWRHAARLPVEAEFRFVVPLDHPALAGHFPGRPIVPGVLLLDQVLTHLSSTSGRQVALLRQVKFLSAMLPGETARVAFDTEGQQVSFSVTTLRQGVVVALASGSLSLAEPATPLQ